MGMLVIRRKPGEEVHIIRPDGTVERIKVLSVVYGSDKKPIIRLGIDAPKDTQILREELLSPDGQGAAGNES